MKKEKILVLRTCGSDLKSYGGFCWPRSGPVECADWDPRPVCGHGLHGLPWGVGGGSLLNYNTDAKWLVVEVDAKSVVEIDKTKVKFPRGVVVHCGDQRSATGYILAHGAAGKPVAGAFCSAGHWGTAAVGDNGTAAAGDRGTAIAGDYGTAIAGNWGIAIAGYRGTATAGDKGTAIAGDGGTATAGDYGTATAGGEGTAIAGYKGTLLIKWWDGKRDRVSVGYVGEGGLRPNTPYRCDENGKLVEV